MFNKFLRNTNECAMYKYMSHFLVIYRTGMCDEKNISIAITTLTRQIKKAIKIFLKKIIFSKHFVCVKTCFGMNALVLEWHMYLRKWCFDGWDYFRLNCDQKINNECSIKRILYNLELRGHLIWKSEVMFGFDWNIF